MQLLLDRDDLREESKDKSCSQVGFNDLTDRAQVAVRVVGKGRFETATGTVNESYNVVHAPGVKP